MEAIKLHIEATFNRTICGIEIQQAAGAATVRRAFNRTICGIEIIL